MSVEEQEKIDQLNRYDVFYNYKYGGATSVSYIQGGIVCLRWFTGDKAGKIEKVNKKDLLKEINTTDWERTVSKKDRGRKSQKFFESLFNCVSISDSYTEGDSLPRHPREERYVTTGISYRLFDHTKELSDRGASVVMHYIKLSNVYSKHRVFSILEREGVETFMRHATRLSHPATYEFLLEILSETDIVQKSEYTLKDYPNRSLIIKVDIETDNPEEKTSQLNRYLQANGFQTRYKRDSRFNSGRNPRVLLISESKFNGNIKKHREKLGLN